MLENLLERFRSGDRRALARLLTLAGRGERFPDITAAIPLPPTRARVVAFTGSGGVGKSTLIGKMIDVVLASSSSSRHENDRTAAHRLAVLACDPQSPLSGGALLGDRFRMGSHDDDRLFIRSLAALSGHSALADHLPLMIRLLEAFGFDIIFLETVGAGQGDTAVRALADVVVLLLQPESGDDLQWEKAGVLEVADVIAVHKADLPGAEDTIAQVRGALDLSMHRVIQVIPVSSKAGSGLQELWQAIVACPSHRSDEDAAVEVLRFVQEEVAARFREKASLPDVQVAIREWQDGKLSSTETAFKILSLLIERGYPGKR